MTTVKYLLLALLLAGCDTSSTTDSGTPDSYQTDGGPDRGPTDGPVGESLTDRGADAPPPPTHWERIDDTAPTVEEHTVTVLKSRLVLIAGGNKYDGDDHYQDQAFLFDRTKSPKFSSAGTMTTQRGLHTATLLNDGRVLVTGGQSDTNYLERTELYDPAKNTWAKGPDMFKSRWSHSATLLQNGEVLVAGGFYSSDVTPSIVIYDPVHNTWKVPSATLNEGRMSHTATLLQNGKVLFAGGVQGSSFNNSTWLNSMEIYDPKTGTMSQSKVTMSKRRAGHTATLLPSGKVLIVGGFCGLKCTGDQQMDDLYDPASDTVAPLAHAGDLPSSHVAVRLLDGRVLVAGDNDTVNHINVVAYDPKGGGFWTKLDSLKIGRWGAEAALLDDGSVLVVGGATASSPTYLLAAKAEWFIH